ncbi:MAG: lysozyme [Gemmatimonadetes bacterium]|nr:lysozyme [Gemmatimonadota bacterium]
MDWKDRLFEDLKRDEGVRLIPYMCPANKKTIGIGRNLEDVGISEEEAAYLGRSNVDDGITDKEAKYLCQNDIERCHIEARGVFTDFDSHPDDVKRVVSNMMFNLGLTTFRKFKKTIVAIEKRDYALAAIEAEDSRWFNQVGERAQRIVDVLRTAAERASV